MVTIRGVAPEDQQRYRPFVTEYGAELFRCFHDSMLSFPHSAINDGYCDCQDGSDEPGTEACAGQRDTLFYCPNELSLPSYIYTSHVNDGVCDCCDGSDEWQGRKSCLNTCDEEGRALREMHEQRISDLRNGLGQRVALIEQGRSERNHVHEELAQLRTKLPELEAAERSTAPPLLSNTSFVAVGVGILTVFLVVLLILWRRSRIKVKLPTTEILRQMQPLIFAAIHRCSAEDEMGIHVEVKSSGGLIITSLKPGGLVDKWNCEQQDTVSRVREGDEIVAIEHITSARTRSIGTSAKDMEIALKSEQMVLTIFAHRDVSELQTLSGIINMKGLDLKTDVELSEVVDGKGGLVVAGLGPKLKERNARLRNVGACISQLVEVGDRLVPFDDGESFASLTKFRFPDQVRLDTFDVVLERSSSMDKLGMHLQSDPASVKMKLMEIFPGSLLERYCSESETCKVLAGDHLISANGKETNAEMSSEFRESRVSLHFGRYADEEKNEDEMPIIRPSLAFAPKRISQSIPMQSNRHGLKVWLFVISIFIAILAVALAIAFDSPPDAPKETHEGVGPEEGPNNGEQVLDTEGPKVSEYAKWMDGADAALSETGNIESQSENGGVSLSAQPSLNVRENNVKTPSEVSDGSLFWLLKQAQSKIMGVVRYVIRTEPYSPEAHSLAKSKLSEGRNKEKDLERKLARVESDNEDLLAYSSLDGKCISKQVAEYNYEACFYKSAKQGHMSIGTWKHWEKPHIALFDDGTTCPGGPARSLRVKMRCGSSEEIVDVAEPSRCTYEAIMTHPAACSDARLDAAVNVSRGPRIPYVDDVW